MSSPTDWAARMRDLHGRAALVTGASRGIGPHIASVLADHGVRLALTARSLPGLDGTARAVRGGRGEAVCFAADVEHPAERERLVEQATRELGEIDILVNTAGVECEGLFSGLDSLVIARTIEVNLGAPLHLARLVLPGMLERRRGHIATVASLAGKKGTAFDTVYSATKAGLIEWSDGLRAELRETGVGTSVICPGFVLREGMFARFGLTPPWTIGSTTPEKVAGAVVDAIRRDRGQVIVNSRAVRPLLAVYVLFPGLGGPLVRLLGIEAFQKRIAGVALALSEDANQPQQPFDHSSWRR